MDIRKLKLHLENIFPSNEFVLLGESSAYEYQDGVKSDKRIGTTYTVGESLSFERFTVKILDGKKPIYTQADLDSSDEATLVSFTNAIAKFYVDKNGNIQLSVKADAMVLI